MLNKTILMVFVVLLIPGVQALDAETVSPCGGSDKEFIIDCLGDAELFFQGLLANLAEQRAGFSITSLIAMMFIATSTTATSKRIEKEGENNGQ